MNNILYCIYSLSDPRTQKVRYIGLSKDVQKRYKQHVHPHNAAVWVQELLEQGQSPILNIIENNILDKATAEVREQHWIYHFEGQGYDLQNLVKNEAAHRERSEIAALRQRLYTTYASHLSAETAQQLIKMMLEGHEIAGICAWENTYTTVARTINLLSKEPGFGLQLDEIDAAKITFNLFGCEWKDGQGGEVR